MSKYPDYSVSALFLARFGWRTHTVLNMDDKAVAAVTLLPDMREESNHMFCYMQGRGE